MVAFLAGLTPTAVAAEATTSEMTDQMELAKRQREALDVAFQHAFGDRQLKGWKFPRNRKKFHVFNVKPVAVFRGGEVFNAGAITRKDDVKDFKFDKDELPTPPNGRVPEGKTYIAGKLSHHRGGVLDDQVYFLAVIDDRSAKVETVHMKVEKGGLVATVKKAYKVGKQVYEVAKVIYDIGVIIFGGKADAIDNRLQEAQSRMDKDWQAAAEVILYVIGEKWIQDLRPNGK